jgi:hypothetical protein
MVEQHVRGARRSGPEEGADDAARRLRGLEGVELEPLVQVVGAAHGHELVERMEALAPERAEMPAEPEQPLEVGWRERSRIGRHHAEDRLHRHRHVVHQPAEQHHGVGIARRVPAQLATRLVGIGPRAEVVPVLHRCDRALERQDLQTVSRQLEVADDLGAQQAHHVGEHRELEAGEHFLGDRLRRRSSGGARAPASAAGRARGRRPPPARCARRRPRSRRSGS